MGTATILVVDDERKIRDLVRSYLELEGYTVLVADSGDSPPLHTRRLASRRIERRSRDPMQPPEDRRSRVYTVSVAAIALAVMAATEFRVPLATLLTLGLVLVCPLLMVGMHDGGHGPEHRNPSREGRSS